jgi:hypothetical protein
MSRLRAELRRFAHCDGGFLEGDWALVIGTVVGGLAFSSYLGWNIGEIVSDAFDRMIMDAMRKAGGR